jgi:glycine cleavage system H protein
MAVIPEDKRFTRDHVWIEMDDEFVGRCGITDYILEKIDAVVYVDFPDINLKIKMYEKVCFVESDADIFYLNSPVSGRIVGVNMGLENDPDLVNREPMGEGWIFKLEVKEPTEFAELMDEHSYRDYIEYGDDAHDMH